MTYKNITGQQFARLTAVAYAGSNSRGDALWRCRCVCAKELVVRGSNLRAGTSKSCGCLLKEVAAAQVAALNTTHGMRHSRTYTTWHSLRTRCNNPKNAAFANYGGRGITVCARWSKFENFLADMGERPEGLSLERRDNDLGYSPDNCYWATRKEQAVNRRTSVFVEINGVTRCFAEWAAVYGIDKKTANRRYKKHGWEVVRALTTPVLRQPKMYGDNKK